MLVHHFLERNARENPDGEAIVSRDRRTTWADLDRRAGAFAARLARDGVARDDRVLLHMENSLEAAAAIFGVLKLGAVFSVINATTKRDKLAGLVADCRPAAIVTDRERAPAALAVAERAPSIRALYTAAPEAQGRAVPLEEVFAGEAPLSHAARCLSIDLAAIIYTSGSTGVPKGVMLTHHNIVSAATSITTYLENVPTDRVLNVLPFSFDYGLYQLLM
ncbi:MAG: acyl--CoA ligase, partial [Planctomycetes bacterium]|nr:acyl--CoA ligase [Planctomycetota bacterium]